ncbi:MAG TPA: exosortase/archaeosortase family protein, partial [Gemmatimonadales bacterium]|nr:exosortase/archaeosortase family protein [Gemmatimonadales bacterium]
AVLFGEPARLLVRDWWNDPEAGHGLLLGPVAVWLTWKAGRRSDAKGNVLLGLTILLGAVLLRYVSGLAAELFTMRMSMVFALVGLTTYYLGFRQVLSWWLPFTLLVLSIPLPEVIRSAITLPLQFRASRFGAALLEWRGVPVRVTGNVILVPGYQLFVTEACSGLRSLTALVSLAVLMSSLWLRTVPARAVLLGLSVLIAVLINAVRVFLTGFLMVFVDPKLGEGFMHITEGWLLFLVSLTLIWATTWILGSAEKALRRRGAVEAPVDA